jgi:hypothetical protein
MRNVLMKLLVMEFKLTKRDKNYRGNMIIA